MSDSIVWAMRLNEIREGIEKWARGMQAWDGVPAAAGNPLTDPQLMLIRRVLEGFGLSSAMGGAGGPRELESVTVERKLEHFFFHKVNFSDPSGKLKKIEAMTFATAILAEQLGEPNKLIEALLNSQLLYKELVVSAAVACDTKVIKMMFEKVALASREFGEVDPTDHDLKISKSHIVINEALLSISCANPQALQAAALALSIFLVLEGNAEFLKDDAIMTLSSESKISKVGAYIVKMIESSKVRSLKRRCTIDYINFESECIKYAVPLFFAPKSYRGALSTALIAIARSDLHIFNNERACFNLSTMYLKWSKADFIKLNSKMALIAPKKIVDGEPFSFYVLKSLSTNGQMYLFFNVLGVSWEEFIRIKERMGIADVEETFYEGPYYICLPIRSKDWNDEVGQMLRLGFLEGDVCASAK